MRSAAQLERKPAEWIDHQAAERQVILRELRRDLAHARAAGEPWLEWIEARAAGRHEHELRRDDGSRIACPVPGCAAVSLQAQLEQPHDARQLPAGTAQLAL